MDSFFASSALEIYLQISVAAEVNDSSIALAWILCSCVSFSFSSFPVPPHSHPPPSPRHLVPFFGFFSIAWNPNLRRNHCHYLSFSSSSFSSFDSFS